MIRKGNKWYSAFPPAEGQAQVITNNSGILAVTANEGLFCSAGTRRSSWSRSIKTERLASATSI
jgi:hypothetical protein